MTAGGSELRTRLILGPTMLALLAGIYWLDTQALVGRRGVLSAITLGLLAVGGVREYVAMMRGAGHAVASILLTAFTAGLCATAPFFGWSELDRELYPLAIGTIGLLYPLALRSLAQDRMRRGLEEQGATLLGFVLVAWPMFLAQGMALRHLPSLLFVVLVCKGGDIGGYLVGVALGRRKLIPHVSKGKTVEGALGSLVFSCVLAVLLRELLLPEDVEVGLTGMLGIGIMLNLTTQTGDLVESLLKRSCGVKDSSKLLPAHGGILDLVDSLLFSFPAYFVILVLLTGAPS